MSNIFCAKWCIHASKFWIICTGEQGYANTGANLKELQRYLSYQIFRYSISTLLRLKSRNNHLKCLQIVSQYWILFYVYCVWWSLNKMWPETETNCCTRGDVTLERRTQDPIHLDLRQDLQLPGPSVEGGHNATHSPRITTQCTH